MHAFDRQTDRRTDRRTEISSLRPRCIPCSAVKINATENVSDKKLRKSAALPIIIMIIIRNEYYYSAIR